MPPASAFAWPASIDQSPEFLRYLSQAGLEIGAQGSLVANEPARESVTIRLGGDEQNALARGGRQTHGAVNCIASQSLSLSQSTGRAQSQWQ